MFGRSATIGGLVARARRIRRDHPLVSYTVQRVVIGAGLVFIVSVVVFLVGTVLPGDTASRILGRSATAESLRELRAQLGLDRPVLTQLWEFQSGLVTGDLGTSTAARRPVSELISEPLRNSMILAAATVAILVPLSILLGVITGLRPGTGLDNSVTWASLAAISVPEFVVGTLIAVLFGVTLGWFPPVSLIPEGDSPLRHLDLVVLPALTLVLVGMAYTVRMMRATVIEVMQSDFIEMAELNGIGRRRVVVRHAIPNGLAPTVQVIAMTIQWFIGGVFIIETVFGYPGIGRAVVEAVTVRDVPFVSALAVLIAAFYIAVNVIADLLVILLNPKLRTGGH